MLLFVHKIVYNICAHNFIAIKTAKHKACSIIKGAKSDCGRYEILLSSFLWVCCLAASFGGECESYLNFVLPF